MTTILHYYYESISYKYYYILFIFPVFIIFQGMPSEDVGQAQVLLFHINKGHITDLNWKEERHV